MNGNKSSKERPISPIQPVTVTAKQFRWPALIFLAVIIGAYLALALLLNLPPFKRHAGEPVITTTPSATPTR